MAASRNLTLTEELEKLEQSITLTLQEIDHNFHRAHRIVTTSILPIVQNYAAHSEAIWSGSKFWKEFFEASANISLTGYEEADEDETQDDQDGDGEEVTAEVTADVTQTTVGGEGEDDATITTAESATPERPSSQFEDDLEGSSLLDSPSVSVAAAAHGTPKARAKGKQPAQSARSGGGGGGRSTKPAPPIDDETTSSFADYPSPYETLKQDISATQTTRPRQAQAQAPTTPGSNSATPPTHTHTHTRTHPSPFIPTTQQQPQQQQPPRRPNPDPLLHRILDKTYRIGATPHTARRSPSKPKTSEPGAAGPTQQQQFQQQQQQRQETTQTQTRTSALDLTSSPFSPAMQAPQLRAEIFGTPSKYAKSKPQQDRDRPRFGIGAAAGPGTPRTPGVSVQRPRGLAPARAGMSAEVGSGSGFTPAGAGTTTGAGANASTGAGAGGGQDPTRKTLFTDTMTSQPLAPPRAPPQPHPPQTSNPDPNRANTSRPRWDDSDSDDDDSAAFFGGLSPPKTMQLQLPSLGARVVRTPAREASRRIVEGLLGSAGGSGGGGSDDGDGDDGGYAGRGGAGGRSGEEGRGRSGQEEDEEEEASPSVVRVKGIGFGEGGGRGGR